MSLKYLWKLSVVAGLACGVYAMLVFFFPEPTNNWVCYSLFGLAITFGCGPEPKKTPIYLCCLAFGCVWGTICFLLTDLLASWGITNCLSPLIVITIVTFLACVVHLIILPKTWLSNLAVVFVGICCFVATGGGGDGIAPLGTIELIVMMCFGSLLAISLNPITKLFHKDPSK